KYSRQHAGKPVSIKGRVIDKITRQQVSAKVYAEEDSTAYSLLKTRTDSVSGAFVLEAPQNSGIHLAALREGYLIATLDIRTGRRDTSLVLELEPALKGGKMILFNIYFQPNKAAIQPNSLPELERLLEFMQQSADKYIRITGHTNANVFTSKSWLLDLSVYRAAAVRDYLTGKGIDPARIRIAGAGGSRPLVLSNDMREAMKNLRVEIELLN
ncbi:MAG TPA: OmpA family protein, partial [Anseongella sp.]|nr:OmpA family protein [Anseongella sp.]